MADIEARRNTAGKVTSYRVRWRVKVDGKWVRKTQSFDPTAKGKTDAKRFAAEIELSGGRVPAEHVDHGQVTVRNLVERYLEDRAKSTKIRSDRTVSDYGRDARLHIYPALGDKVAGDLDTDDVQDWISELQRHDRNGNPTGEPASGKTAQNVHGVLAGAYKWGVKRRLVTLNPCEDTELPERSAPVVRGLRVGEWHLVHQAAIDTDPLAADLLLFLVGTGWRWSEAAALQVLELELERTPAMVQVGRVFRRQTDNTVRLVEGDAKSQAGLRRVKLPESVAVMLRRRVAGRAMGDFVFTTTTGLPLRYGNFRERLWKPTIELATARGMNAKPTMHWLRHSQVAMLLEVEPNLAAIQKRVGHADITTTTRVYGSLIDDVSDAAIAHLDAALTGQTLGRPKLHAVPGTP